MFMILKKGDHFKQVWKGKSIKEKTDKFGHLKIKTLYQGAWVAQWVVWLLILAQTMISGLLDGALISLHLAVSLPEMLSSFLPSLLVPCLCRRTIPLSKINKNLKKKKSLIMYSKY